MLGNIYQFIKILFQYELYICIPILLFIPKIDYSLESWSDISVYALKRNYIVNFKKGCH